MVIGSWMVKTRGQVRRKFTETPKTKKSWSLGKLSSDLAGLRNEWVDGESHRQTVRNVKVLVYLISVRGTRKLYVFASSRRSG